MSKRTLSKQQEIYIAAKAFKDTIWSMTLGSDREDIADEEWMVNDFAREIEFQAGEELIDWALDAISKDPKTAALYRHQRGLLQALREKVKTNYVTRRRVIELTMSLEL